MDDEEIRVYLQTLLEETFDGVTVYYRPPGNLLLSRPCIVYEAKASQPSYANNTPYIVGTQFQVTLLSNIPGTPLKRLMLEMEGVVVQSNRSYVAEDVVHDVFSISVNSI